MAIGIGVIGLGNVARHHMRILASVAGARVVAGADPQPTAREKALAEVPGL